MKRQRPSGAQRRKEKRARDDAIEKQKNSLDKYSSIDEASMEIAEKELQNWPELTGGAGSDTTGEIGDTFETRDTSHVKPERGAAENLSCSGSVDDGNFEASRSPHTQTEPVPNREEAILETGLDTSFDDIGLGLNPSIERLAAC